VDQHEVDSRLRQNVAILREKQAFSYEQFSGQHDVLSSAEHDLQIAIQAAIDIGLHYGIVKNDLDDLEQFVEYVTQYLLRVHGSQNS